MNKKLTLDGHIVYTVSWFAHRDQVAPTPEQKETLDLIHLAKIEESDAIFVIDGEACGPDDDFDDPYVGDSTRREIAWAAMRGKQIYYLSEYNYDLETTMNLQPF